jgi:adenosylcobinamide-GDP ribazoletransferase
MLVLTTARPDGMAARLGAPPLASGAIGIGLACTAVVLAHGAAALLGAGLAGAAMAWLARRQVGGYTGDVLGATEQAAECAALVALLIL